MARPDQVGLSPDRLQRVDQLITRFQGEGRLAGAVTVVARDGKLAQFKASGFADLETKRPMRTDDIFLLQSMTKPIATVAALILLEQQRFLLSDAVEKFLPEFRGIKVAEPRPGTPLGYELVPTARSMTIHDLLTHRAGFPGVPPSNRPAEALRREALKASPRDENLTLEKFVTAIASAPLDTQPGTIFRYGDSTAVLGRVIEVVSGKTLDVFLQEEIFARLGMDDTGFVIPAEKRGRVVANYSWTADKGLAKTPPEPETPRLFSAGGNLYSTPGDYLRFCQMLLNGGEFGGQRIISRKTVELMTARHVDLMTIPFMRGQYFGLGVAVQKADGESGLLSSPGTYGWSGAYNTYFRIDPQEKLVLLLFVQVIPANNLELQYGFQNAVMQAIAN